MIEKQGNLYVNGKLYKNKYDRNEEHGFEPDSKGQGVERFYEIICTLKLFGLKISISRERVLVFQKDFMSIAFDPPVAVGIRAQSGDSKL